MRLNLLLPFVILCIQSCSKATQEEKPVVPDSVQVVKPPVVDPDTLPKANYDLALLSKCLLFNENPTVINMQQQYRELSGIAASSIYKGKGLMYVHEDSGNGNEVYITNTQGDDLGKIVLDGVSNRDWEDIVCGPGPDVAKTYIYIAEIGDNDANYSGIVIYRFPEPDLTVNSSESSIHVTPEKLQFVYPNGAVNAETLLLDPVTKDLYILTKEIAHSTLFVARYPQSVTAITTLTPLASLPFDLLTSGDISTDGAEILLRNTGQIWYWKRLPNETITQTILREPQDAPYAANEHQGEGICFAADGAGYFTNTETKKFPGEKSAITFYQRK